MYTPADGLALLAASAGIACNQSWPHAALSCVCALGQEHTTPCVYWPMGNENKSITCFRHWHFTIASLHCSVVDYLRLQCLPRFRGRDRQTDTRARAHARTHKARDRERERERERIFHIMYHLLGHQSLDKTSILILIHIMSCKHLKI